MSFKISMVAGAVALGFTGQAIAADLPIKAARVAPAPVAYVYNWSGWYGGIHGGWGSADYSHDFNENGHYNHAAGDSFGYRGDGAVLGAHFGYNWQAAQWVYGLELSATRGWLKSGDVISPFFPTSDVFSSEVRWFGSVTGRLGWAANNWLFYGKGGWAIASAKDQIQDPGDFISERETLNGWTAGAGIEYGITQNWIFGVEYNHYDFGSAGINTFVRNINTGVLSTSSFTNHDFGVTVDTVTARLSYKW